MAVGVHLPARISASKLDQALLSHSIQSNAMSYNSPLHVSGASLPSTELANAHTSEDQVQLHSTLADQAPLPSPLHPFHKKRRPSKTKAPPEIKRSSSTPHMQNLGLTTSGELSPTDKRRNKLGYHRTSVACGHCRRRKIRCLVANEDPTGRCANCIRLKKECNFYPVEQTPDTQRSHTGSVRETSVGAPASSTTSSPLHPASVPSEKVKEFRTPFSGPPPSTLAPRYGVTPDTEVESPRVPHPSELHVQQPPFSYPHPIETHWPPTTGFLPSSSVAEISPSSSTTYWRPSPSTTNSAYGSDSNVSGGYTPTAMSATSNLSYGSHHDGPSWGPPLQPPTRSMSYGNIEGLPQQHSSQGLAIQPHDFPRRTSPYPYPTSLDTNSSTLRATTLDNTSGPLSAPIMPNQQYTYPPPWNPYGGMQNPSQEMHMQGRSMSGQWYPEPVQLDQVQEEEGPPMAYSNHGIPQYFSGP